MEKSLHDKHASLICLFFSERSWPRKQTASKKTTNPATKDVFSYSFTQLSSSLNSCAIYIWQTLLLLSLVFPLFISSCASFFSEVGWFHLSSDSSPTSCLHAVLLLFSSLSLNLIWSDISGLILTTLSHISFSLPASLPPAAGGRFRGPGGDNLTVDSSQQQHEPDGSEHLGGRYPMRLWDSHIQDCCCHCEGDNEQDLH